ncbi:C-C motif chemokine 25 isoform X3 [Zalophus californianus]|uniref:C-C motif chemokine 25 isoform X3 n=1 Tax=Zalophus californianus TaxID=9704 RepID=A0A6J2CHN7_ZALCA|nr:C-C motif chemokine 25 isoform X3 [Zalophus californianus]
MLKPETVDPLQLLPAVPISGAKGVSEDCCLAYNSRVRPGFLRHARGYRRQEVSGSCNLPAVIFFFPRNKILCANPRDSWVPKMVDFLDAGNKTLSKRHWRHLQVILFGGRKSNTGISKLLPKVSRLTRSNNGKTTLLTKANPGP